MSLQLLERLSDFDKEVRSEVLKASEITPNNILPMQVYYDDYIKLCRPDVKSFSYSHLRDYIHFSY